MPQVAEVDERMGALLLSNISLSIMSRNLPLSFMPRLTDWQINETGAKDRGVVECLLILRFQTPHQSWLQPLFIVADLRSGYIQPE